MNLLSLPFMQPQHSKTDVAVTKTGVTSHKPRNHQNRIISQISLGYGVAST